MAAMLVSALTRRGTIAALECAVPFLEALETMIAQSVGNTNHMKIPVLFPFLVALLLVAMAGAVHARSSSLSAEKSCTEFLVKPRKVGARWVGQEDCRMREVVVADDTWPEIAAVLDTRQGKAYRRIEVGLTGTLTGYAVRSGPRLVTFTSAPDFVFVQAGNRSEPLPGVLRYDMQRGASMSLIFPEDGTWNGKLFVTLPGMGSYRAGTSKTWDRNYVPDDPMGDVEKHHKLMLLKGYAVALTRRNHLNRKPGDGDYAVFLDDGTVLLDRNPADNPELIIGYAQVAQRLLRDRLGRAPAYTYWYGHSGGARLGKLVNYNHYRTEANTDADGKPVIDGIIVDDSGAGLYLPHVYRDGEDILFRSANDREPFVPMLEIAHQLYINDRNDPVPDWVSTSFLINKYKNARALRDKGLGDRFRFYEVRGISHDGGENLPNQTQGDVNIIPMWQLMDGFIDMLDAWVARSVAPPPSRSDWAELGDMNRDGVIENDGIALPQVACPLGVYYPFPPSTGSVGQTAFAAFDGVSEEPFDGRSIKKGEDEHPHIAIATFADMNRNGYRDFRETVTEAWRRLGLLELNENFSRERYVSCVEESVGKLTGGGFISSKVGDFYIEQAQGKPLPDWVR